MFQAYWNVLIFFLYKIGMIQYCFTENILFFQSYKWFSTYYIIIQMLKPKAIYFQIMENGKKWKNTFHSSSEFQSSKVRVFQGREPRLIVVYYRSKINREGRVKRTHYPLFFFPDCLPFPFPYLELVVLHQMLHCSSSFVMLSPFLPFLPTVFCFILIRTSLCYCLSCLVSETYFSFSQH